MAWICTSEIIACGGPNSGPGAVSPPVSIIEWLCFLSSRLLYTSSLYPVLSLYFFTKALRPGITRSNVLQTWARCAKCILGHYGVLLQEYQLILPPQGYATRASSRSTAIRNRIPMPRELKVKLTAHGNCSPTDRGGFKRYVCIMLS